MPLPPLPSRASDTWTMGPAFEKTGSIFSVSARAGRVLVGGHALYRLRAGTQNWQQRELPLVEIPMVWNVAQEPWAPWREAVASERGVSIFLGKEGRIVHVSRPEDEIYVTNLAWGLAGGRSALFVLWDDGQLACLHPEDGTEDVLDLPKMAALAADENGCVAMLHWEEHKVYVTDGSEMARFRHVEFTKDWYDALPETIEAPFHLAVAGKAVAVSVGWEGAFITRDLETTPFTKCEPLSDAGPLVFEGASPDSALFGGIVTDAFASIVRVDASGRAVRIGDVLPTKNYSAPFDEIAWDAARRRVFGVHRLAGVVAATAPDAKGGKLVAPS